VLTEEDGKHLAKAISGFANSSGGLIVWCVDCCRDSSGAEVAFKMPVLDANGFNTKLQGAVSRSSIPPHSGVEIIAIQDDDSASSKGFVAMLVPQSTFGPVCSVKSNRYYMRTGSDFAVVPHDVLAGMFGRAPLPRVDLNLLSHPARLDGSPGNFTIAFGLVAVNLGVLLAERPYVSVHLGNLPNQAVTVQVHDTRAFSLRQSVLPVFSVIAEPHVALALGGADDLCDVVVNIPIAQPQEFNFECMIGGAGTVPQRFKLKATLDDLLGGASSAPGAEAFRRRMS
jgi:hypothetical protein